LDFTIKTYKSLLKSLQSAGFFFITFEEYFSKQKPNKWVILRHDVDLLPENSLRFAKIQNKHGIKGTYYFRAVPESWDERIIKEITELGHEVGYHYETMDQVKEVRGQRSEDRGQSQKNLDSEVGIQNSEVGGQRSEAGGRRSEDRSTESSSNEGIENEGRIDRAYELFCENLERLRKLVPVKTICMHGSPKSRFDNKDIWKKYDYQKLGILGEPYFDVNFDDVFYLTDTGRRWDGYKVSVRDKLTQQENWNKQGLSFHSTNDIIKAINNLPNHQPLTPKPEHKTPNPEPRTPNTKQQTLNKIMFTFHPQRWHDKPVPWMKEMVMQNVKNVVKYFLIKSRKR
jgi:hypothetical protein